LRSYFDLFEPQEWLIEDVLFEREEEEVVNWVIACDSTTVD